MAFVYKIINKINGKSYVGYTSKNVIEHRVREHFSPSVYEKNSKPLYKAIKKYGKNNFDYVVLFEGTEEESLKKEIEYIKMYGDYNIHPGGNVPPNQSGKTWKMSENSKQKLRKPKPPRTEEHKNNLSLSLKGNVPWNKGKTGVQQSFWKGQRNSPRTAKWKITKSADIIEIENLVLWCENNGYNTSSLKGRYYSRNFPYKDILNIEKVE
jgi:group I intron endonuclease